jgi:hypothetical protein
VFTNNTAACNDGSACTNNDVCGGGVCAGTAITCNDNNACTTDSCNPGTGCVFTAITCNDNIGCTTDGCNPATGCVFNPVNSACPDDGNVCTDSVCSPSTGCGHANNTAPCNDGNLCTQTDQCAAGACVGGNPVICPANLHPDCDLGACNPATGLCTVPNGTTCSDGSVCSVNDACQQGQCVGDALDCVDAVCLISGNAGDTVSCPIMIAQNDPLDLPAVGIQFSMEYDTNLVSLQYFEGGEFCLFPGAPPDLCFPIIIPDFGNQLDTGHQVNLVPSAIIPDWDAPGVDRQALIINVSAPTPLTDGLVDANGDLISGDPVMMEAIFTLDAPIPANAPVIVYLLGVSTTDEFAGALQSTIDNFMIITAQ